MSRWYATPTTDGAPPAVKNQGRPTSSELVFKVIPDATTQLDASAGRRCGHDLRQPAGATPEAEAGQEHPVVEATLNSLIYLGFNTQQAPFDDVRVRQALCHAVNKDEILQTALGGIGKVAFAPLASTLPGFDPALKQYELGFDLAQARALLAEAGFSQGAGGMWARGTASR